MTRGRGIDLPFEHLTAELAAIPLASPSALRLGSSSLARGLSGATAELWRAAEHELVVAFPSFSIDDLVSLRDWLWFRNELESEEDARSQRVSLAEYTRALAEQTLEFVGNMYRPQLPPWAHQASSAEGAPDARARRFWRWISFALPPDLLMAAHPAVDAVTSEIELVSPILARILYDEGYTEPHLHIGAAIRFTSLWIACQHVLAYPDELDELSFQSPGAQEREGRDLADRLIQAVIVRYMLALYLKHLKAYPALSSFEEFLHGLLLPMMNPHDPEPDQGEDDQAKQKQESEPREYPWQARETFNLDHRRELIEELDAEHRFRRGLLFDPNLGDGIRFVVATLDAGQLVDGQLSFRHMQSIYARLTGVRERWATFPRSLEGLERADTIDALFPSLGGRQQTSEMAFIRASMRYMLEVRPNDEMFARLFWQVARVRTIFYRHVVQRPMTPGLQWFVRFFRRLRNPRKLVPPEVLVHEAARTCGIGHGLKALELRTSPGNSPEETQEIIRSFQTAFASLQQEDDWLIASAGVGGRRAVRDGDDERGPIDDARRPSRALDPNRRELNPLFQQPGAVGARGDSWRTEFGLVLHFTRDRGGGAAQGVPKALGAQSNGDPQLGKNYGIRYASFYREKRREALGLATVIRRYPRVLRLLRAIDLCTDELGVPTWVLAPLCRYVRDVSNAASAYLQNERRETVPPLRMTVHAGEDFTHVLGGLRRIDEAVTLLKLGQGDRIGHAMALGVNTVDWAARVGAVAVPTIDRLMDLAWEWSFATSNSLQLSASRLQHVIDQIEKLSRDIFSEFAHPPQVARFLELLRDARQLRRIGFPEGPVPDYDEFIQRVGVEESDVVVSTETRQPLGYGAGYQYEAAEKWDGNPSARKSPSSPYFRSHGEEPWRLLYRYLTDRQTFRKGQSLKLIDPSTEGESLRILQDGLRRKLGATGITVEINPSSNLLIGNLSDLRNHPLWRIKPPVKLDGIGPVAVCIGTDNPITFMTGTREEYQLVYDTLTLAGLSDMEARQWLQEVRESGLESRFTLSEMFDFSDEQMWQNMDVDITHVEMAL